MGIIVTQNNSGSSLRKASNEWRARESWMVTGIFDKGAAIDAAIAHNSPHPLNPNLTVCARDADNINVQAWKVYADYAFGDHGICANTPLDEPIQFIWEFGRETDPIDIDTNFQPIVNSAGMPIENLTDQVPIVALVARRALPFFNVQYAAQYINRVNSDPMTVRGMGNIDVGQCYCEYIRPMVMYTNLAPFVWIEYRFEFRLDGTKEPFQIHVIDQGRMGWYSSSGTPKLGQICDSNGDAVGFDVPLDGTGIPINTAFYVRDSDGNPVTPIANPTPPVDLEVDTTSSSSLQKTLLWRDKTHADFRNIFT